MAGISPKTAKDIAKARVDEAEAVAVAYAIQTHSREVTLAHAHTPTNYRRVVEARAQLAAAKRHLRLAKRETR